ncbi:MAG: CRISPR-associated endonuclease Cas3'' [Nitrospiria bacterium]
MTGRDENQKPIAHVRQDEQGRFIVHDLEAHLSGVAHLASGFAAQFGSDDWAHRAGLWHDLGKYSQAFQRRISHASTRI